MKTKPKLKKNNNFIRRIYLFSIISVFAVLIISFITISVKTNTQSKAENLKIIGGTDVKSGEYPMVALVNNRCTGVLIHPNWVLTAAHCINPESIIQGLSFNKVAVGITDRSDYDNNNIENVKIVKHSEYDPRTLGQNDLALIHLDREIAESTLPILPQEAVDGDRDMYQDGNMVTIVGWGVSGYMPSDALWKKCLEYQTEEDCRTNGINYGCIYHQDCRVCMPFNINNTSNSDQDCREIQNKIEEEKNKKSVSIDDLKTSEYYQPILPNKLQKITLPIYSSQLQYAPTQFAIGYEGEKSLIYNTGHGDSGGPVFFQKQDKLYLLGIVWGIDTNFFNMSNSPSQAMKLINYAKWINETIAGSVRPTLVSIEPTPIVDNSIYSKMKIFKACGQYQSKTDCNQIGQNQGCRFHTGCDICMPTVYSWLPSSLFSKETCDYIKSRIY